MTTPPNLRRHPQLLQGLRIGQEVPTLSGKNHKATLWEVTVFAGEQETDIGVGPPENFSGRWP